MPDTKTYNKIIINGTTYIDLSADTVTAATMLATVPGTSTAVTAHDKNGATITGTIASKAASNVTVSGATVTIPAGYYASEVTKTVSSGSVTLSDPSISITPTATLIASGTNANKIQISGSGSATVSATVTAGYISSVTDTGNVNATASAVVAAEDLDTDLKAANIKTGVKIFNTTGTFTADATATAGEILSTKTAYVNGSKITGTMANNGSNNVTVTSKAGTTIPPGFYDGGGKAVIDSTSASNLVAANILNGVTILGVTGTLDPSSEVAVGPLSAASKFTAQTFQPGDSDLQFFSSVSIAPISVSDDTQTTGTTGYTVTVSDGTVLNPA